MDDSYSPVMTDRETADSDSTQRDSIPDTISLRCRAQLIL